MTDKKIPQYLRCRDNHPTMVKYRKLADFADELGISLYFQSGCCFIYDKDRDDKLPRIRFEDIEDHHIFDFPYPLEYKMIYENPAYLEDQERKHQEYLRQREEERIRKEAEESRRKEEEELKKAKEQEQRERTLLADLKRKYES